MSQETLFLLKGDLYFARFNHTTGEITPAWGQCDQTTVMAIIVYMIARLIDCHASFQVIFRSMSSYNYNIDKKPVSIAL
jgi:hypothetical protein